MHLFATERHPCIRDLSTCSRAIHHISFPCMHILLFRHLFTSPLWDWDTLGIGASPPSQTGSYRTQYLIKDSIYNQHFSQFVFYLAALKMPGEYSVNTLDPTFKYLSRRIYLRSEDRPGPRPPGALLPTFPNSRGQVERGQEKDSVSNW